MTVVATPRWQSLPRRTATPSCRTDYLGTPIQALDSKGEVVWDCVLDIYGEVFRLRGERDFIPFRFQGQYEDGETGLYYNRYRYYSPETGTYISQDPIRLAGANPTLYGYVFDPNTEIDPFGLDCGKATSIARKYEQQIQERSYSKACAEGILSNVKLWYDLELTSLFQ